MPKVQKFICIHGHFYQPPRENPWLERIEIQETAAPFHDWNQKITYECYVPNAKARILDEKGRLVQIVNNYSHISFDFGPTLLLWMEKEARSVYELILEADAESMKSKAGHGNAIAQAFNHIIMPLASRKDKETQIIWAIRDFKSRFHRDPEGIWLPETAVDSETLEILIDYGIKFTILAQKQAAKFRDSADKTWEIVNSHAIDPSRPYLCNVSHNKSIVLFFYDGPISQSIAFEGLLHSGMELKNRLLSAFSRDRNWPQLVHIATDGESYGHHHRFGEMALAFAIEELEADPEVKLTNYGAYLAEHPPQAEAEFIENSAWSCAHGIGRWSDDCGCCTAPRADWNQKWRKPLREALDYLRDSVDELFVEKTSNLLRDPWNARNHYIDLIISAKPKISAFLKQHQIAVGSKEDRELILSMLEMQRNRIYMYTSCGWFFDDIAGLEALQILRYAARVLQLASPYLPELQPQFLSILDRAITNSTPHISGAKLFKEKILPQIAGLEKVAAHIVISSLFEELSFNEQFYCFNINIIESIKERSGEKTLLLGRLSIVNTMTTISDNLVFAVIHHGGVDLRCSITGYYDSEKI